MLLLLHLLALASFEPDAPLSLSPIINPWLHSLTRQTCPPPQRKSLVLPPRTTAAVESALRQASQSQSGPVFGSGSNLNSHNH